MADSFGKLVVRPHAPRRRAVLVVFGTIATVALLYLAFELGRYDAGYRVVDSVRGAFTASARIRELEAQTLRQRTQLEAAEVARRVDREGYMQVERSLGDMQSQIARLNQDLSFYRGLVQPDSEVRVKVQQMQIVPQPTAGQFRLRFVLMQTGKPVREVSGTAALTIDGLAQGKPATLNLADVSANRRTGVAYSFRYFQDYDEAIELPAGFEPTRIGVEIRSGRDASRRSSQAFLWKAQGMSLETDAGSNSVSKGGVNVQAETE